MFYGEDKFKTEELFSCFSQDDLNWAEILLIKENNSLSPNGYNIDVGGKQLQKTPESIKKGAAKKRGMAYKNRRRGIIAFNPETNDLIEVEVVKDFLKYGFTNLSNIRLVLCGKRKQCRGYTFKYKTIKANQNLIVEANNPTAVQRIEAEPATAEYNASKRLRYLSRKDDIINTYKLTNSSYKASVILGINRNTLKKLLKLWGVMHTRQEALINRSR